MYKWIFLVGVGCVLYELVEFLLISKNQKKKDNSDKSHKDEDDLDV